MKLQGLSVIFCLIAVPIILVLTAYIQSQITTISMQLAYDTKLLDATHDAMVALEINTANEDLSTVSDSLRSIVSASTNTFINSLSTNMGMSSASKSALQPYVPAILVTSLLSSVDKETRNDINRLLKYPDNSAGSLMATEYIHLKKGLTIKESIDRIRKQKDGTRNKRLRRRFLLC